MVLTEATLWRWTFLESLAVARASKVNFSMARQLWMLVQQEEQWAMAQRLHVLSCKGGCGTLTSLSKVVQMERGP